MSVGKLLIKTFSNFKGVDYEASDLIREPFYASELLNADFSGANSYVKRKGAQAIAGNFGGYGLGVYEDVNVTTGAVSETMATVDDSLYTLVDDSFNVTYSGSNISLLNIGLDVTSGKFYLTITENETSILSQDLGIGYDEASATAVSAVISAIDGLSDYAASGGTVTTGSAAFLNLKSDVQLSSTATSVGYRRWAIANESKANPLATSLTFKNATDYENPSYVSLNNVLYVSTGYDYLHKYDGQTFYRAGMPAGGDADGSGDSGVAPTTAETGSGTSHPNAATYYYKYTYRFIDNKGNVVEGVPSPISALETIAAGVSTDVNVTVTNLASTSGFNTNCAIVNGVQAAATTIAVDSGHTINVGDTLYFYDTATAAYVNRTVTAKTATTLTFVGAVSVADNAVISNNLRIAIYRTQSPGSPTGVYYLVAEVPNDSIGASTQVVLDAVTDAAIGAEFVEPLKSHGLPPKAKYAVPHVSQLILAGDRANANKVYYSDVDSPEYFPAGDNSFLVDAFDGSKIYGLGSLDANLYVFKDRSIQAVSGDLAEDAFRVDDVSFGQVGCAAHHTIQKVAGSLMFLSKRGVYSVNSSGVKSVGDRIVRKFTQFDVDFNFQKSLAVNWIDRSKYLLFMPEESQDGSPNYYANSNSRIFAYDYDFEAWIPWSGLNAQGGMAFAGERLFMQARRLDSNSSAVQIASYVFNEYGSSADYSDHVEAITFTYSTHWESLGEPNVFKRFTRLKTFCLPNDMVDGDIPLFEFTVKQEFNYVAPAVINSFTVDFSGDTTGWGNGGWGDFPWGDSALPEIKSKLKSSKVRSMRLTFENDVALSNVLLSGFELECAPPYAAQMKE